MSYRKHLVLIGLLFVIFSCNRKQKESNKQLVKIEKTVSKADQIINAAINAHGGDLYEEASYSFIFRTKEYSFKNEKENYKYEVNKGHNGKIIKDMLNNTAFTRFVDGKKSSLSKEMKARYAASLNSVIYFALLPYKLNDLAVNKTYEGISTIKGQDYDVVKVTFNQEGGGEDFNDQFYYWIHTKTKTMDYLAYNYNENEAGVRFRSAYNVRTVEGIRFQDYINYKATVGTPLKNLPALYEKGDLVELSRIEIENIISR